MSAPIAYLITWTAYGSWLPGDARGWVRKGEPVIQPGNGRKVRDATQRMRQEAVLLSPDQRETIRRTIEEHCRIRGWRLDALNIRSNHVHLVVAADLRPESVMEQLKAWCSRRLNESGDCRRKWWTEHGSTKWINDVDYHRNAIRYVKDRQ